MEEASENRRARNDADILENAIEQIQALPKDKRSRAKKQLAEDGDFMSALSRCLLTDQPALDIAMKIGPDTIFRCLTTQDISPQDVEGVASRVRKLNTEAARQLWIGLMSHLLLSGWKVDVARFATIPEASLPQYASGQAGSFFAAIETWLEDEGLTEYLKRKLASILILSLPTVKGNGENLLPMMVRLIPKLRKSRVDAKGFSEKVPQAWIDRLQRFPPDATFEIANALSQVSDGFQTRFWDEKQLGPFAGATPMRPAFRSVPPVDQGGPQPEPPNKAAEILSEPQRGFEKETPASAQTETLQGQSPAAQSPTEGFASPDLRSSPPMFLKWLSEVHSQIGSILQTATEASVLKQRASDVEQKLRSAEAGLQNALENLRSSETAAEQAEASLERLQQSHSEVAASLATSRSRMESAEKRVVELESIRNDCDVQIRKLKAELDEAQRSRILYGDQRAVELKNSFREKIGIEIAVLPSLGPELSSDNFPMLRVRFRNLLKLLREMGIIDSLPGEGAR